MPTRAAWYVPEPETVASIADCTSLKNLALAAPMPRPFQFSLKRMLCATGAFSLASWCLMLLMSELNRNERSQKFFLGAAVIAFGLGVIGLCADSRKGAVWGVSVLAIIAAVGSLLILIER